MGCFAAAVKAVAASAEVWEIEPHAHVPQKDIKLFAAMPLPARVNAFGADLPSSHTAVYSNAVTLLLRCHRIADQRSKNRDA